MTPLCGLLTSSAPSFSVGLLEVLSGLVFFPMLFHTFSALLRRTLKGVPDSIRLDIANKTVSAVFACGACLTGFSVLQECGSDVMSEKHPIVRHYMSFGLTYFLYDLYSMNRVFQAERREAAAAEGRHDIEDDWRAMARARWIMVLHHLLLPLLGYPVFTLVQNSLGDCLIACGFLMEASTPFVSLRAVLARLEMKRSLLYVVNGVLMNIVFFFCRILVFPYIYYRFAIQLDKSILATLTEHVPLVCNVSMGLLFAPQLYWFWLMLKGSLKVIKGIRSSREDEKKKSKDD